MPSGAVYVGRPTQWGNPWTVSDARSWGIEPARWRQWLVTQFREEAKHLGLLSDHNIRLHEGDSTYADHVRRHLAGKDLVCWCPPGQPCHADVLLEIANGRAVAG